MQGRPAAALAAWLDREDESLDLFPPGYYLNDPSSEARLGEVAPRSTMGAPAGEKGPENARAQFGCGVKAYVPGQAFGGQRTRIMSSLLQSRRHGQGESGTVRP